MGVDAQIANAAQHNVRKSSWPDGKEASPEVNQLLLPTTSAGREGACAAARRALLGACGAARASLLTR